MIVGCGSESFRIVRDLVARLPVMVLPCWSRSLSQPVAIADVVHAIVQALRIELKVRSSPVYGIPGPEPLSARDASQLQLQLCPPHP